VSKLISHGQLLRCQAEAVARDRELQAARARADASEAAAAAARDELMETQAALARVETTSRAQVTPY